MLHDKGRPDQMRGGLLIDFDYASQLKREGKVSPGFRTVRTSL